MKKIFSIVMSLVVAITSLGLGDVTVSAAWKEKTTITIDFSKGNQYNKRKMQNFVIVNTSTLFVIHKYGTYGSIIKRFVLNDNGTATYKDSMKIENAVHGETLEAIYDSSSQAPTFLIGCVKDSVLDEDKDGKPLYYSSELALVKYEAGGSVDAFDCKRIFGWAYTPDNLSSGRLVSRVTACADDKDIVVRAEFSVKDPGKNDKKYSQYFTYDKKTLLSYFGKDGKKRNSISKLGCTRTPLTTRAKDPGLQQDTHFQAMESYANGQIYVLSGYDKGAYLTKFGKADGIISLKKELKKSSDEPEGFCIYNGKCYYGMHGSAAGKAYIYNW